MKTVWNSIAQLVSNNTTRTTRSIDSTKTSNDDSRYRDHDRVAADDKQYVQLACAAAITVAAVSVVITTKFATSRNVPIIPSSTTTSPQAHGEKCGSISESNRRTTDPKNIVIDDHHHLTKNSEHDSGHFNDTTANTKSRSATDGDTGASQGADIVRSIKNPDPIEDLEYWKKQRNEERAGRIRAEVKLRQVMKDLKQLRNEILLKFPDKMAKNATSNERLGVESIDSAVMSKRNENIKGQHQQQVSGCDNSTSNNRKSQNQFNSMSGSNVISNTSVSTSSQLLLMESIGKVVSPFTKRMGTPRQPQLVPDSRGYIQLTCPSAALDGIMEYSHVWIIFEFHANTTTDISAIPSTLAVTKDGNSGTSDNHRHRRTKIRPPRAPTKVGILATRTPHRINPIGLSCVRISSWDPALRRLHVTGLDLVNGTPVYDIKPYVPWDIPGYYKPNMGDNDDTIITQTNTTMPRKFLLSEGTVSLTNTTSETTTTTTTATSISTQSTSITQDQHKSASLSAQKLTAEMSPHLLLTQFGLKVLWWVIQEDEIQAVTFTSTASHQLYQAICGTLSNSSSIQDRRSHKTSLLAPLYTLDNDGYKGAMSALKQILAQDPRSSHKGLKNNARGTRMNAFSGFIIPSNNEQNKSQQYSNDNNNKNTTTEELSSLLALSSLHKYNIIFGTLQVSFVVIYSGVHVTDIEPITFDPITYADGIPLVMMVDHNNNNRTDSTNDNS